mgnify:CR=1 FL=1
MNLAGENNHRFLLLLFPASYTGKDSPKALSGNGFWATSVSSQSCLSGKGKRQGIAFPLVFAQTYAYQEVNFSLYLHRVTPIRK